VYSGHKRYFKRIEEEKMKRNENWMKEGGVEMLEKDYVWSGDVIGGRMGELSVEIEFEKEKEENCSSFGALFCGNEKEKNGGNNIEGEKEEKKEEEEIIVGICGGLSTTSLTFVVD
jgi:hypothetical protein